MIDRISIFESVLVNESGDPVCTIGSYAVVREEDLTKLEEAASQFAGSARLLRSQKRDLDKIIASMTNHVTQLQQELRDLDTHATNVERARAVAEEQLREAKAIEQEMHERTMCFIRDMDESREQLSTERRTKQRYLGALVKALIERCSTRRALCGIAFTAEQLVLDGLSPRMTAIRIRDAALCALDTDIEGMQRVLRGERI